MTSVYVADLNCTLNIVIIIIVIIIIKRISRAPIYHTRWEHRALYNNTNHTLSVGQGDRQGCEKQFRNTWLVDHRSLGSLSSLTY